MERQTDRKYTKECERHLRQVKKSKIYVIVILEGERHQDREWGRVNVCRDNG